ncbi:MAG: hypothetical protein Q4A78_05235 [Peptostreptococcaceae bacterium]|nr:hypothetical protein [Peptostreptococcaceae bacterium]
MQNIINDLSKEESASLLSATTGISCGLSAEKFSGSEKERFKSGGNLSEGRNCLRIRQSLSAVFSEGEQMDKTVQAFKK